MATYKGFPGGSVVKNLSMQEMWVRSLGQEDPLEKEMATTPVFSRQGYWSGLPFLSPRDLPNPGIESGSPSLQADSLPAEPQGKPKARGGT